MAHINDRWYTAAKRFLQRRSPFMWWALIIWALSDVVLLPITLPLVFLLGKVEGTSVSFSSL